MRFFVLFPKPHCIKNRSLEHQRIIMNAFTDNIKKLVDADCQIRFLIEDSIAKEVLDKFSTARLDPITVLTDADIYYLQNYPDPADPLTSYALQAHLEVEHFGDKYKGMWQPDPKLMFSDKETYQAQCKNACRRRRRAATNDLIKSEANVLVFRDTGIGDRSDNPSNFISQGDGRIVAMVDLENSMMTMYYGGIYLESTMFDQILNM